MARPLWTGAISFGLVSIPVELYSATQDRQIHFHMVTPDGKCRLRRKLVCPESGKEYDFSETARGFEVAPDEYVVVDQEELEALQPEKGEDLELQRFVELADIDPILFRTPYYLLPRKKGEKAFQLLAKTLRDTHRVGIGEFIMREKEYLACVRPYQDILSLETFFYADELKKPEEIAEVPKAVKVSQKELDLAKQLVESLTEGFNYSEYKDEYRVQLMDYLKKRAKSKTPIKVKNGHRKPQAAVFDLTARLKESLKKRRGGKGHEQKRAAGE